MKKNPQNPIGYLMRFFALLLLVVSIVLGTSEPALAKRASGRVGGSSFRAPARTAPIPRNRSNTYYRNNDSMFGGGFYFLPFFMGGGGGSLLSLIVLVVIGSMLVQAFRNSGITSLQSKVAIAKVQVGLLASARGMQNDLNRLALESDTQSPEGLARVLQETSLSLLRHPEYWVYGKSQVEVAALDQSEQKFNALALGERSKHEVEALSNVNNRLQQRSEQALPENAGATPEDPSEYIVVTLLVAAGGEVLKTLPIVRSTEQLHKALAALGAVPASSLLALEVIWEPQSTEYTLTADEMVTIYPDIVRL